MRLRGAAGSGSAAGVVEQAEAVLVEPFQVDGAGRPVARQLFVSQRAAEHQYAVVPHPFRRPELVGLPLELTGVGEEVPGSMRATPVDSFGREFGRQLQLAACADSYRAHVDRRAGRLTVDI